jgi:hypothetical protein
VTVSATMGKGSDFELTLPTSAGARPAMAAVGADYEATLIADTEEESIRR